MATLALLDEPAYGRMRACTDALADGLQAAALEAGVPVQVPRTTGLLCAFFSGEPVDDLGGAQSADADRYARFCRAMLDDRVYLPPSPFEAWFPAQDMGHVELSVAAARRAFAAL
jgi:glutamate-1-semialdehyde 2,1-aminomutase